MKARKNQAMGTDILSRVMQNKEYCVYGLLCPEELIIKYVGCTVNIDQRYRTHLSCHRGGMRKVWINELRAKNLLPILVIIEEFDDKEDALECERTTINKNLETLHNLKGSQYLYSIQEGKQNRYLKRK
jgi:predicted GIY-YIG superfamily endonuclease